MLTLTAVLPLLGPLPLSLLDSDLFQVLATFVAINSLIYATLAVLKVLPRPRGFLGLNGRNRRTENRSIYPHLPASGPVEAVPESSREVSGANSSPMRRGARRDPH